MKITVIVAEYNPLHNGHIYHIEQAKKFGDPIIVLMSGAFVQRGEPAIFDKYKRAETAVLNGVDAVFEIPAPFSFAPADKYAFGAFKLIQSINADVRLSFGSESGDIEKIIQTAKILLDEPKEFKDLLKMNLDKGFSFAKACGNALEKYAEDNRIDIVDITKPNNILAVEYAKNNILSDKKCELVTHKRIGEYKGNGENGYRSASAIRKEIANGEAVSDVPEETLRLIENTPYVFNDSIYRFSVIRENPQSISKIFDVNEGLENRLYECVKNTNSYEEAISACVCGRYSESRIRRVMTNVLLGVDKENFLSSVDEPPIFNLLSAKKSSTGLFSYIDSKIITSQSALEKGESVQAQLTSKAQNYYKIIKENAFDHTIFVD